jgi:hypothetical protein
VGEEEVKHKYFY